MKVTDIHALVNSVTDEVIGDSAILLEDLSNVVDVGTAVFNSTSVDHYVKTLIDKVGRVVFDSRVYQGFGSSITMDAWEYGAVLQKVKMATLLEATENSSWNLTDGVSYDPFVFHKPDVQDKFYSDKTVFNFEMSFTQDQVKSAFTSADQLRGFISMIELNIQNSANVKTSEIAMRTINNFTAVTLNDVIVNGVGGYEGAGTNRGINLLKRFNDEVAPTTPLTVAKCLKDPDFLRFASFEMSRTIKNLTDSPSTLFNMSGYTRYTPKEALNLMMLAPFASASEVYLQSDTYHKELVALPNGYESVAKWQGSGLTYAFSDVSKIHVKPNTEIVGLDIEFNETGILALMFDRQALAITNKKNYLNSQFNPKGRFYNQFYEYESGFFNDFDENFVVFYVSDPTP